MKKERTRNLLPAKIGFYGIIIFVGHFVFWHLAFALKVELLNFGVIFSRLSLRVPLYITYFKLSFRYI